MNGSRPVFILCPAGAVSGGPEALHQLAATLRTRSVAASIVYYATGPNRPVVPVPYRRYDVAVSATVNDDPDAVVVIPEVVTSLAWTFPRAQKAIWWLSVDNYFKWQHCNPGPDILAPLPDIAHLCQSAYALDFLTRQQARPLLMLTDFVAADDFTPAPAAGRLPVVAYNPKKAPDTMQRLMAQDRGIIWLPLQGLDKATLADLLRQVRLYVDFGPHPGRDRIPREAALCGAVVITGRRGAAGFASDVPLPERFRLDETTAEFECRALGLIDSLLHSEAAFLAASAQQDAYRDWIRASEIRFSAEVDSFVAAMARTGDGD
jgi:hypothetical protein